MKALFCAMGISLSLTTSALAGSLENRVFLLEQKVLRLQEDVEKLTPKMPCLTQEDGVVPSGVRSVAKRRDKWVYDNENTKSIALQILREFATPAGVELIAARTWLPGRSCEIQIFRREDLVLNRESSN